MGSQEVASDEGRSIRRERRLWLVAAGWLLLIYSTLYYVRGPIEFLREQNLLRLTVAVVFLLSAATVAFFLLQRGPGRRALAVLTATALVYIVIFLTMERAEEKLHFLEYGVFAGLVYAALLERRQRRGPKGAPSRWPATTAILLSSAAGWGDEGIQAVLPNRFYDLRDVGLNVAAAVVAVGAMGAWRWAEHAEAEPR